MRHTFLLLACAFGLLGPGCADDPDRGPMESAGKKVDETVDTAMDAVARETARALLHAEVRAALLDGVGADALRIDIDVEGDRVHLEGEVAHRETAELAATLARDVEGVREVESDLEVKPRGTDDPGLEEIETEVEDQLLEARVRVHLLREIGADAAGLTIEAADGKVVLTGTVDSAKEAERAGALAEGLDGVTDVVNRLEAGK